MLFVGDDWAEAYHDVELMDATGWRLAQARLPAGVVGVARLHVMIVEQWGEDAEEAGVLVGTETERGPWVAALIAAGYRVYAITGSGMVSPGPRATLRMRTRWRIWCAPIPLSCAR